MEMVKRNLMVFFLAVVSILLVTSLVAASDVTNNAFITVDDIAASNNPAVVAGDIVTLEVRFTSDVNASDVRVKALLEGDNVDVDVRSAKFDVEDGYRYDKTLKIQVPQELDKSLSDSLTLTVTIWNGDYRTEQEFNVRVQRPSYKADVKSVGTPQTIQAGSSLPVDVVLENQGYNDLNDVFVTVRIPALNIERSAFFGDIVALKCTDNSDLAPTDRKCDDNLQDTVFGRINVDIPYEAKEGTYALEVEVKSDDSDTTEVRQFNVKNGFSEGNVIVSGNDLIIVNPTNQLKVFRVVPETSSDLAVSVSDSVVAVPAGSSRTVSVSTSGGSAGTHSFNINVFDGATLAGKVTMSTSVGSGGASGVGSPVVVLTVILAIIFIVLLVVLIVLLGKRPEKSEEFGESYY